MMKVLPTPNTHSANGLIRIMVIYNKLNKTFPCQYPDHKKPSRNPIKLECSLSVFVTKPIEVKTEILINAKKLLRWQIII
jgi:hypothetical protein